MPERHSLNEKLIFSRLRMRHGFGIINALDFSVCARWFLRVSSGRVAWLAKSEKDYDRNTVITTLKLICKMGTGLSSQLTTWNKEDANESVHQLYEAR